MYVSTRHAQKKKAQILLCTPLFLCTQWEKTLFAKPSKSRSAHTFFGLARFPKSNFSPFEALAIALSPSNERYAAPAPERGSSYPIMPGENVGRSPIAWAISHCDSQRPSLYGGENEGRIVDPPFLGDQAVLQPLSQRINLKCTVQYCIPPSGAPYHQQLGTITVPSSWRSG